MTEQLSLLGAPRTIELTDRQQYALEQIERADGGLASDELGAVMHERRGKHDRGVRCSWCPEEGKGVAGELRRKGLVVRKQRTGMWQSLRPLASDGAPLGAGAPSEASGTSGLSAPSTGFDSQPESARRESAARSEDDSFGAWMDGLPK